MVDINKGIYHLTLVGSLHNQQTQNGYWFVDTSEHEVIDYAFNCIAIINDFHTFILDKIKDFANQQWSPIALVCATMYPRHGPIAEQAIEQEEGIQQNASLPSFNAGVLSLRTGFGGRSSFGRSYYAGISEDDHDSSRLTVGSLTRLSAIGNSLLARYGDAGSNGLYRYCLYSHKLGDVPATPPDFGKVITHAGVKPITQTIPRVVVGTCRHRKLGIGS